MKRLCVVLLLTSCVLSGCTPGQYSQLQSIPPATKPTIPTAKESCDAAGGHWSQQGLGGGPMVCDLPATDAFKICTDNAQCQGACRVEKTIPPGAKALGSCSEFVTNYGCQSYLKEGRVVRVCTD